MSTTEYCTRHGRRAPPGCGTVCRRCAPADALTASTFRRVSSEPAPHGVRIYRVARTAHLERINASAPAEFFYERARYDFDPVLAASLGPRRVSAAQLARHLLVTAYPWAEVNEPLAAESVRYAAVSVAAIRLGDQVRGRRTTIVSYAIGNLDPYKTPPGKSLKYRLGRAFDRRLAQWLWRRYDRLAFGTEVAQSTYAEVLGPSARGCSTITIPPLPVACACLGGESQPSSRRPQLTFLGDLSSRKGFDTLLEAWPEIVRQVPAASWTIIGKGAMTAHAASLASSDPRVAFVEDPPRSQIHSILRSTDVLVLASRSSATWSEQVGLPIVEGLAHGATIVSSSASGLAPWLHGHGHRVISDPPTVAALVSAAASALSAPMVRAQVVTSLPPVDGRIAADRWLVTARKR